jgi:hypothetical protein
MRLKSCQIVRNVQSVLVSWISSRMNGRRKRKLANMGGQGANDEGSEEED